MEQRQEKKNPVIPHICTSKQRYNPHSYSDLWGSEERHLRLNQVSYDDSHVAAALPFA